MEQKVIYYPHLDVLKGIAILLMVMGHVIPWTLGEPLFIQQPLSELYGSELYLSVIYRLIYSFHMPLLFFASGFLFYRAEHHGTNYLKNTIIKRVHRILIPYLVTGTLLYFGRGHWGYWFLQDMFVLNLFVSIIFFIIDFKKVKKWQELAIYITGFILLYIFRKLTPSLENDTDGIIVISRLANYYPAFIMGILCRKYNKFEQLIENKWVVFISLLCFIGLFILSGYKITGLSSLSSILLPLTMIIYLNNFTIKTKTGKGIILLSFIGKNSLEIYILHLFFIMVFQEIGIFMLSIEHWITSITFQIVYSLTISAISIFLSIITANILKSSNIIKRIMFGA